METRMFHDNPYRHDRDNSSSSSNEETPEVIRKQRSTTQMDISPIKITMNEKLHHFTPPVIHSRPRDSCIEDKIVTRSDPFEPILGSGNEVLEMSPNVSISQRGEIDVHHQAEDRHDGDNAVVENDTQVSPEAIDLAGGSEFEQIRDTSDVSNGRLRGRLPKLDNEKEKNDSDDEDEVDCEQFDRILAKLFRKYIWKSQDDPVDSDDSDVQLFKECIPNDDVD